MENNGYYQPQYDQQPQYAQQPQYYKPVDPNYEEKSKSFLTKAIVACCICSLPVGSIIAIAMGTNNRKDVLDYINNGGLHTTKIQVCSALSRASKYAGIAYTCFWAFYLLYIIFFILIAILGAAGSYFGG